MKVFIPWYEIFEIPKIDRWNDDYSVMNEVFMLESCVVEIRLANISLNVSISNLDRVLLGQVLRDIRWPALK